MLACEFFLPICADISVWGVPVPWHVTHCPSHWLAIFNLGAGCQKWKPLGNLGSISKLIAVISYPLANNTVINNLTSLKLCTVGHMTFIKYKAFCDSPKKTIITKISQRIEYKVMFTMYTSTFLLWASNVLMIKLLCQGPSSVFTTGSTK